MAQVSTSRDRTVMRDRPPAEFDLRYLVHSLMPLLDDEVNAAYGHRLPFVCPKVNAVAHLVIRVGAFAARLH